MTSSDRRPDGRRQVPPHSYCLRSETRSGRTQSRRTGGRPGAGAAGPAGPASGTDGGLGAGDRARPAAIDDVPTARHPRTPWPGDPPGRGAPLRPRGRWCTSWARPTQRQAPLQRIARPALRRLVDQTTQNAHLSVLHGRDVLYLIEERAVGRPLLVTDVGVRLPAVLTASGLAMLARLPARQVRALYPDRASLVQRNERGPTSPTELRRLLIDVRARGFGVEDGSVTGRALVDRPCGHRSHWAPHRRRCHHLRRFDGRRAQATLAGRASSRGGRSAQPSAGRVGRGPAVPH